MVKRYEMPDAAWELVADRFEQSRRNGRPRADDRLMLNGVFWELCSGAAWRDMPERFEPRSTVYQRFRDWLNKLAFDLMLKRLYIKLNEQRIDQP
jgi:transposase